MMRPCSWPRAGDVHDVAAALDAGADVHAGNDNALRVAAVNGHTEVVRILIAARAAVNATGSGALRGPPPMATLTLFVTFLPPEPMFTPGATKLCMRQLAMAVLR